MTGSPWRGAATTGYCVHAQSPCRGDPDRQLPACLASEHHYCGHGVDSRQVTSDGQPRCSYCRGVTRREKNRDTWRPRRPDIALPTEEP
jgi:hypothetical protein